MQHKGTHKIIERQAFTMEKNPKMGWVVNG